MEEGGRGDHLLVYVTAWLGSEMVALSLGGIGSRELEQNS
jgi:hypothetical protein